MKHNKIIASLLLSVMAISFTACGETVGDNNSTMGDGQSPTITLQGPIDINISLGTTSILTNGDKYTAYDPQDGDISNKVVRTHDIDFSKEGNYYITYKVTDSDGFSDIKYRTVTIAKADYEPYTDTSYVGSVPVITFTDGQKDIVFVNRGDTTFSRNSYAASDFEDGDLTSQVSVEGTVDTNVEDTYTLYYTVTDSDGNTVTKTRTVYVTNYTDGSTYAETTDLDNFKNWYSDTCNQTFNDSLYNAQTGQYDGAINCSNSNLYNVDLTPLSIFSTIRTLDLSNNHLSDINFNELDLRVNNVKVLEDLDLSYNNFSYIDFTPLHNLRNINNLWIHGNPELAKQYNTEAKRDALYKIFNNRSLIIYFDQY